ncbi:hypothetical protein OCOJLMKI_5263 [Methylobacterium iners]|uniref:CBS domain-containing protein n=1 Tax=Methylobacterium iners TaxID=418707 RepID=A0ABQ4S837_9HYPH|nr:hypothetical protein OCOJLMKI_5263 [Methylobacterium iners]
MEVGRDTVQAMMQDPTNQVTLLSAALVVTNDAGEVVGKFPFADAFRLLPRVADRAPYHHVEIHSVRSVPLLNSIPCPDP